MNLIVNGLKIWKHVRLVIIEGKLLLCKINENVCCHAHDKTPVYWSRMCRQPTIVRTAHLAVTGRVNDTLGGGSSVSREKPLWRNNTAILFCAEGHTSFLLSGVGPTSKCSPSGSCFSIKNLAEKPQIARLMKFSLHCCKLLGPVFEFCGRHYENDSNLHSHFNIVNISYDLFNFWISDLFLM